MDYTIMAVMKSLTFVDDILARDFYADLDTYKNELLVIHGTNDTTVPFDISKIYVPKFNQQLKFVPIEGANHNYDTVEHIKGSFKIIVGFFNKVSRVMLYFFC